MSNLIKVKQIASGTNGQVLTTTAGKSVWANPTDIYVTGTTFNTSTYDLTISLNDASSHTESLAILANDVKVTGGTYDINTGTVTFTNNDSGTFDVTGFTSGMTDTNYYTTGATLNGTTAYFNTNNTMSAYTLDLSGLIVTDTYVTGGTITNGSLTLGVGNASTVNVSGSIIQSVTGNLPVTASTTNGAVVVGIDYDTLLQAVETTDDKNITPAATTGVASSTTIAITNTPARDSYVKVEINGVGYWLADGNSERTTADCYFSSNAGSTAKAISDIVASDVLFWNNNSSFNLEVTDSVNIFYEILQ